MAGSIVRLPAAWPGGAALFGKVARHAFSPDVIPNPVLTVLNSTALRSMIFHRKLLHFFLAAREKAVVRLSEAEDSGAPLHRRLKIVGEKCAAHLVLTDGFRMALGQPPGEDVCPAGVAACVRIATEWISRVAHQSSHR
uniref:Uncharacterized protein n=1 Tax=Phasianus colchicus TaxID=9054 RepID=A0A669QHJ3_PHACC